MKNEKEKIQEALEDIARRLHKRSDEEESDNDSNEVCPFSALDKRRFALANILPGNGYGMVIQNGVSLHVNFFNTVLYALQNSKEELNKQIKDMKKDFDKLMDFCVSIQENKENIEKEKTREMKDYAEKDE